MKRIYLKVYSSQQCCMEAWAVDEDVCRMLDVFEMTISGVRE